MIPLPVLLSFLTAIIAVFWGGDTLTGWNNLSENERNGLAAAIQNLFKATKKDLSMEQTTRKAKEPDDFEGNPEDVNAWCRRMTMYFQSNGIKNKWEQIEIALGKIRKGKDNRAQQWADTQIRKFLPFQEEWKNSNLDKRIELDVETMKNKPSFTSWNEMTKEIGKFFILTKTQTHAIK